MIRLTSLAYRRTAIAALTASAPGTHMRGVPAFSFVLQHMGKATHKQQMALTRAMRRAFGRVGLTTGIDSGGMGAASKIYRPILDLWCHGNVGFRTHRYVGATEHGSERQQTTPSRRGKVVNTLG